MPKLRRLSCRLWIIVLTTSEDQEAVRELGFDEKIGEWLDKGEASRLINVINDRANQLRNPSFPQAVE